MKKSPFSLSAVLPKATIAGLILAVLGIILFGAIWIGLGNTNIPAISRLFAAFCIPPAVIAGILIAYIVIARPYKNNGLDSENTERSDDAS